MMADLTWSRTEKVQLYRRLFSGRPTGYGTYDPVSQRSWTVKKPVDSRVILRHLQGIQPYGIFLLHGERTPALVIDFDDRDTEPPLQFIQRAGHYGLSAYLERSKSKGYHVWIFFERSGVRAEKARRVAQGILEELECPGIEIFPKQDRLDAHSGWGNFINAPYFGRLVPEGKTVFLDLESLQPVPHPWKFLAAVEWAPESVLDTILDLNPWSAPTSAKPSFSVGKKIYTGWPPCAQQILEQGVTQFQRVACFRLAVHFHRTGFPLDIAVAALKQWAGKNRPHPGKRVITEGEIVQQVQAAYQSGYSGCGCEDPAIRPFCRPDCPLYIQQKRLILKKRGGDDHDNRV